MTDMGKYQCYASNGKARDQNGHIIVAEETMGLYIKCKCGWHLLKMQFTNNLITWSKLLNISSINLITINLTFISMFKYCYYGEKVKCY